ncbi:putative ribonuclease H-like domain-containing protein [Tanacetum coccineum]
MYIVANSVDFCDVKKSCVNDCNKCLELETELFKKKDFIEKEAYDKLVKSYSNLEKHCISLELATQLNQEIFQRENSGVNLNAHTFNQLFKINELKAQSQEKDTVIRKLKERIKSLSGKDSVENVKKDIDEIETINIELEHSVPKLLSENENLRKEREHLKSIYKDQFDSIRKTRVQSKEHCDSLIAQINAKSVEKSDLNAQLQEKVVQIVLCKKHSHQPKAEDSIQEILYLLHMDLCGPMRVQSINRREYILVIVDDFSRFTWVKFLRLKDKVPEFVIKFLKMIQVCLNATVRNIKTDNGTEFVNHTLKDYYEEVRISHQTSVAHTPQQNGIVERRNRTLVEAAQTMLIFSKAPLFLWAEAVVTACYTQNDY